MQVLILRREDLLKLSLARFPSHRGRRVNRRATVPRSRMIPGGHGGLHATRRTPTILWFGALLHGPGCQHSGALESPRSGRKEHHSFGSSRARARRADGARVIASFSIPHPPAQPVSRVVPPVSATMTHAEFVGRDPPPGRPRSRLARRRAPALIRMPRHHTPPLLATTPPSRGAPPLPGEWQQPLVEALSAERRGGAGHNEGR